MFQLCLRLHTGGHQKFTVPLPIDIWRTVLYTVILCTMMSMRQVDIEDPSAGEVLASRLNWTSSSCWRARNVNLNPHHIAAREQNPVQNRQKMSMMRSA